MVAEHEKTVVAAKSAPNGRNEKCPTAANKGVVASKVGPEPAKANVKHARPVEVLTQCETDAKDVHALLQKMNVRPEKVERELWLMNAKLRGAQKRSAGSAKAASKALCQLTKVAVQEHRLGREIESLQSWEREVGRACDDVAKNTKKLGLQAGTLKLRTGFLH